MINPKFTVPKKHQKILMTANKHRESNEFDQAIDQFEKFLSYYKNSPLKNAPEIAGIYEGLAYCYLGKLKFKESKENYEKILAIGEKTKHQETIKHAKSSLRKVKVFSVVYRILFVLFYPFNLIIKGVKGLFGKK